MKDAKRVHGHVTPTTPPSTPLDTLKALVLRTVDNLNYVLDQFGGGPHDVPEDLLEFVDFMRQEQLRALAEHVPVARDERLNELRHVHPDGLLYEDGSPVLEHWDDQYGVTGFYPRYDGDRTVRLKEYNDWVAYNRARAETETKFNNIVNGIEDL